MMEKPLSLKLSDFKKITKHLDIIRNESFEAVFLELSKLLKE